MARLILGPLPATIARAKALAGEVHARVFRGVVQERQPYVKTFYTEIQTAYPMWREHENEETADKALSFACDTLSLEERIKAAQDPPRRPWWRR